MTYKPVGMSKVRPVKTDLVPVRGRVLETCLGQDFSGFTIPIPHRMRLTLPSVFALAALMFPGCAQTGTDSTAVPSGTSAPMPGGFTSLPQNDAGALEAARAAAAGIGDGWTFSKLLAAQSQVVAGTNYQVTFSVAKAGQTGRATATVWKKLDGTLAVTDSRWIEKPAAPTDMVAGGFSKLAPSDEGAQAAAKAVAAAIGEGWTLGKVVTAQSQVVAGINYKLTLNLTKGGEKKKASATVWRKLDGSFEVTKWKWN